MGQRIQELKDNAKPARSKKVSAVLGNMRTHLSLTEKDKVWVTVGRQDLEDVMKYIQSLEKSLESLDTQKNPTQ